MPQRVRAHHTSPRIRPGLPAGYYRTTVDIASSAGTASVPVTLLIAQSAELLPKRLRGCKFRRSPEARPAIPNGSFLVSVAGGGTVSWTAAILRPTNSPAQIGCILNTAGGLGQRFGAGTVNFSIDPSGAPTLAVGPYYATIQVTSAGAVEFAAEFPVGCSQCSAGQHHRKSQPLPGRTRVSR